MSLRGEVRIMVTVLVTRMRATSPNMYEMHWALAKSKKKSGKKSPSHTGITIHYTYMNLTDTRLEPGHKHKQTTDRKLCW